MDEIKFCDFTENDLSQVSTIMSNLIFVSSDEIKGYYEKFKRSFNDQNKIQYDKDKYEKLRIKYIEKFNIDDMWLNAGIDLPILFSNFKSNKTILILAQDPLRDEKYFECLNCENNHEDVIIGTPFSLHNNYYRENRFKELFSLVQSIVKEMEARVYISDIYKIFFVANNKKSIKNAEYIKSDIHKKVLEKEICFLNPDLIISLGVEATRSLFKIYNIEEKLSITSKINPYHVTINDKINLLLPMLHPSRTNQKHRKKFYVNNHVEKGCPISDGYLKIIKKLSFT